MGANKWAVVDSWKDKFDQTGEDLFDIIENAIKVATRYRPAGLLEKRGQIGELLFTKFYEDDQSDITQDEETEAELAEKESDPIHIAITEGEPVNEDKIVDAIPKQHIIKIKLKRNVVPKLVAQEDKIQKKMGIKRNCKVNSNCRNSDISSPKSNLVENTLGIKRTDHEQIGAKGISKGNEESQEIKFAASKRRLEEKYQKIESSRKRIRMIELKDLPPQGMGNRCKKPLVRSLRGNFISC